MIALRLRLFGRHCCQQPRQCWGPLVFETGRDLPLRGTKRCGCVTHLCLFIVKPEGSQPMVGQAGGGYSECRKYAGKFPERIPQTQPRQTFGLNGCRNDQTQQPFGTRASHKRKALNTDRSAGLSYLPSFFEFAFVARFDHALNIFLRPLQVRLVSGLFKNTSSM